MRKLINFAKWGATLGRSPQTFLGAKWVRRVLDRSKGEKKRKWALRLLSLSPHYFLNSEKPEYAKLSNSEYLEAEFRAGVESRQQVYDYVLRNRLFPDDTVMDYGCGPGFLAKIISDNVARVYAIDISEGALACAAVINSAPNLTYVIGTDEGLRAVPDAAVDVVVSFAMVQHLTDETFASVLKNSYRKLRSGGRLILHIKLLDDGWRSESEWRTDKSIGGRIRYQYGLHCFGRSEEAHREMVGRHGFTDISIGSVSDEVSESADDLWTQKLLTAVKR